VRHCANRLIARSDDGGGMSDAALEIFISYRRKDTGAYALLLYDRLKRRFGEPNVFLDVEVLRPGMKLAG